MEARSKYTIIFAAILHHHIACTGQLASVRLFAKVDNGLPSTHCSFNFHRGAQWTPSPLSCASPAFISTTTIDEYAVNVGVSVCLLKATQKGQ